MAVTISANAGSAYWNYSGTKIHETSTGQLWTLDIVSNALKFFYSNDDGATWAEDTGAGFSSLAAESVSGDGDKHDMFIDANDNVILAWQTFQVSNYRIRTRVGTISGNAITWSTVTQQHNFDTSAHKNTQVIAWPESTGIRVFVALKSGTSAAKLAYAYWSGSAWSSTGSITMDYSPSGGSAIDFHHTGDGKTVKDGTPHVYWLVTQEGAGAGNNDLRFYKVGWTAGPTWTLGTRRVIDTGSGGRSNPSTDIYSDGTRIVMVCDDGGGVPLVYERDHADTTTTQRVVTSTGFQSGAGGKITYNRSNDDIVLFGVNASVHPIYSVYDRSAGSWDTAATVVEAEATNGAQSLSTGRLGGQAYLGWRRTSDSYLRGESAIDFNAEPTAPTWTAPTDGSTQDVNEPLLLDWVFNDPDAGDTQSAYTVRRKIGTGSYNYWNGATWVSTETATKITATPSQHLLATSWGSDTDADHYYSVKTWDASDAGPSPWSTEQRVVPSAQDNPTITYPATDDADVNFTETVTWTVSTQTKKQIRVVGDDSGNPDVSSVDYDSGVIVDATKSGTAEFPVNNVKRHIEVTTWNDEGLVSDLTYRRVDVVYLTPPAPITTITEGYNYIDVAINNLAGATALDYNEVWRMAPATDTEWTLMATDLAEDVTFRDWKVATGVLYAYKVRAVGVNGAYSESTDEPTGMVWGSHTLGSTPYGGII